jgi:type I restriction enzyme M protein
VVLPDGFLFGEGIKTRIKEKLLEECNLHTIVRLPNGVFAPTPASRPTCCSSPRARPTKDVWFYEHPYPAGVKNYNKTKPMRIEEFAGGYNLDLKNPNTPEAGHDDPDVLLADYHKLLAQIETTRNALRDQLNAALTSTMKAGTGK